MDISRKSAAVIIDELITTNLRCWFAQEDIMNKSLPDNKRLEAAERAQVMNARRSALIKALDELIDKEGVSAVSKTYYTYFDKERNR